MVDKQSSFSESITTNVNSKDFIRVEIRAAHGQLSSSNGAVAKQEARVLEISFIWPAHKSETLQIPHCALRQRHHVLNLLQIIPPKYLKINNFDFYYFFYRFNPYLIVLRCSSCSIFASFALKTDICLNFKF